MTAEVRFTVDESFMKQLQQKLNDARATDIAREAMTIFNWAVDEASKGRVVLSTNQDGKDVHRLVTPLLAQVRPMSSDARYPAAQGM